MAPAVSMGASRTAWLLLAAWLTAYVTVAVAEPESWDPWGMFSRDPSERPREEQGAALRRVRGPAPVNTFESEAASISELVAVRVAEDLEDGGPHRSLLHGCHGRRNTRCAPRTLCVLDLRCTSVNIYINLLWPVLLLRSPRPGGCGTTLCVHVPSDVPAGVRPLRGSLWFQTSRSGCGM